MKDDEITADSTSFNFGLPITGIKIGDQSYVEVTSLIAALRKAGGDAFADQLENDFK